MGSPKGKRSYTLVTDILPGVNEQSKDTWTSPKEIWYEVNQIFQGLYDANSALAERLMEKYPKGTFILERLPEEKEQQHKGNK